MANLYQHWKADPKGTVGIMLTKNWYSHRREEIGPNITYGGVKGFLDYLCGRLLIEVFAARAPDLTGWALRFIFSHLSMSESRL